MRRIIIAFVFLLSAINASAIDVQLPFSHSWGTISPWTQVYYGSSLDTSVIDPTGANTLRFYYPTGFGGGYAPDVVYLGWDPATEVWGEFYFKTDDPHTFGEGEKLMFLKSYYHNFFIAIDGGRTLKMCNQRPDDSEIVYSSEPYINTNTWYKVTFRCIVNTIDTPANGVFQLWVNDVQVINVSDRRYTLGSYLGQGWDDWNYEPTYTAPPKEGVDYLWFGRTRIQTTPFGETGDILAPYAGSHSPPKSATGVLKTNRDISFRVKDDRANDTQVVTTGGIVNIEGTDYSCGSGLTCTGYAADCSTPDGSSPYPCLSVAWNKGSDWAYDQVVNVSINGFHDVQGNTMTTDTYSYTIESSPAVELNITTTSLPGGTVGTSYSQALAATGGISPYTWALYSGSLPAGLFLSSGGVISGTPTTANTYNFTVEATDSASPANTDTQALSIIVVPSSPSGQVTVTYTTIVDTFINSGSPDTNEESNIALRTYQWPYATVANRIILKDSVDLASIPDNVTINDAKLRLYLTGYDGSGGTNPMRTYVYKITGTVPDPTTVTWNNFAGTLQAVSPYIDVSLVTGWFEWNVTNEVQTAYAADTPLYLALDGGNQSNVDTNRIFASADHGTSAWHPQLVVTYTPGAGEPPPPTIMSPGKMRITSFGGTFH